MQLWSRKRIGIGGLQFVKGWQGVSEEQLDAFKPHERKYFENLAAEGLLKDKADRQTGPKPRHVPDAPPTAKQLITMLNACETLEDLDALNAGDDSRSTVATAYADALKRIRG